MGVPTQVPGVAAETAAASQAAGFFGWSAEPDRKPLQVTGGPYKGAYANATAYNAGDVVANGGVTYRVKAGQSVSSSNATAPAFGAVWEDATSHRSIGEITSISTRRPDFYR